MGLLIPLLILILIACIPLGVHIQYDVNGFVVQITVSCFHYTIFPFPKRKKADKAEKPKSSVQTTPAVRTEEKSGGGSIQNFLPFIRLGLRFLNAFRKKMRINNLQLKVILAADDPCDLAVSYGRTWAAVGNLLPALEKVFRIGKRNVEVECDFAAQAAVLTANMDITMTFGRILSLAAVYGAAAIREFWKMKKRKGGAAV